MEILNIEGINFPVAKYTICRCYHYADGNYKDTFYAPADMKFFKYDDYENENLEFEGQKITQQFWIGITEWSEEKEKISHNMHYCSKSSDGTVLEEDDYPIVNSWSLTVHNVRNKYLVWELKDIAVLEGEELPTMDKPGNFKEPIYFVKKAKSEELEDKIYIAFGQLAKSGVEVTGDMIQELKSKMYKPYQYVRINGVLEDGSGYDVTTVTIGSWCYHMDCEVNRIEREKFEFKDVPEWDKHCEVEDCTKEEFDEVFDNILKKIQG